MNQGHFKTKRQFIERVVEDLLLLGVFPGGILMVHPALRPFGIVPDGPMSVIEGLFRLIGEDGTLLMPALSWENVPPDCPIFDVNKTPSCVGLIAETFRLLPETSRSIHPTHSVCAFGRDSENLIGHHELDNTPCGPNSAFHKLPHLKGQILMLACGLIYNTSMHAIEELVIPPYLLDPPITYTITDGDGDTWNKRYYPHNFKGWRQRYDRILDVLNTTGFKSGLVSGVPSFLMDAEILWEKALRKLKSDPLYFVERTQKD
jgi:aminoglycoside 3-N-acetyltransferase